MAARLVLASASPRRRALLAAAGVACVVRPADVDETLAGAPAPEEAARALALRKVAAALRANADPDAFVLAADTVVALGAPDGGWRLLGKPADADDARAMLRALSGSRHRVATGVAAARARDGRIAAGVETTVVAMRRIEEREVEAYVASGEWRDKAGGYAIQETADRFVTELTGGGLDNVVGLPVALALRLLQGLGFGGAVAPGRGEG